MAEDDVVISYPRRSQSSVPFIRDRYYVYALFKSTEINPFYVGKGINTRINQHFMESNLKESDSRKNKTIRKYGDTIRREILCYFDKEQSAFDFEEYLIGYYGLIDEGGFLYNIAKSRHEFPESSKKIISDKKTARTVVYSEDEVVTLYRNYFELRIPLMWNCTIGTRIPRRYSYQILTGEKFKGLYKKYILSGEIQNLRQPSDDIKRKSTENHKVSDEDLISAYNRVCSGDITIKEISITLGVAAGWLGTVFLGKNRPYLMLDTAKYESLPKGRAVGQDRSYNKFLEFYPSITDNSLLVDLVGKSVSRVIAYKRRYNKEKENNDVT